MKDEIVEEEEVGIPRPKSVWEVLTEKGQMPEYLAKLDGLLETGVERGEAEKRVIGELLTTDEKVACGLVVVKDAPKESAPSGRMPKPKYVRMSIFDGKECSEIEAIRWVGRVMGMHGVEPDSCPSAAAWNLMNHCRSDPDFQRTFWSSMFTKTIKGDRVGVERGDREKDGEKTVDLCDRLLEMSERLGGGCREN